MRWGGEQARRHHSSPGIGRASATRSAELDGDPESPAPMPVTPHDTPPQRSALATCFLTRLGRDAPILFRAIMDDSQRKNDASCKPLELVGSFTDHRHQLRTLNDRGYGIFAQINVADGQGWQARNIVKAVAFFADFDGTPLEHVERLALAPHLIVETSPGKRHFYWCVADIPVDQFQPVQKRLISLFGSDKSIHDRGRIMRVPGFMHMKNPAEARLVDIVEERDAEPIAYADFIAALEAAERAHLPQPEAKKPLPATIQPTAFGPANIKTAVHAANHAIAHGALNIAERQDWLHLAIMMKDAFAEDGWEPFLDISRNDESFVSEEDCRKLWDSLKGDRPDGQRLTIATLFHKAKEAGWKAPAELRDVLEDEGERSGAGRAGKPDAASMMVEQADEAGDEHFLGMDGTPYVRFRHKRGNMIRWVTDRPDGTEYEGVLSLRYFQELGNRTAPREQVAAATRLLKARAIEADVRHPVHLRVAEMDETIYVDLGGSDGKIAEIDAHGWRVVSDSPVRFIRGNRGALPIPMRGGTRADFERHFNVGQDDLTRVIAFLIGVFNTEGGCAALIIEGEAGSAKSNFLDKALALTDPPFSRTGSRFGTSTEERNMHVQALHCRVMAFDNISTLTAEISDQLSRLSTGAASSARTHHTMGEETQIVVKNPIVVSCISVPTARTDLLSRSLVVTARRPERRRTERDVWKSFDTDRPKMIGYLFTAVSAALRNRAKTQARAEAGEITLSRMGDFAEFVESASEALGLEPGAMLDLLNDEQSATQAAAVEGDVFRIGLTRYFSREGAKALDVTAAELGAVLKEVNPYHDLPHTNQFKARLARIAQGLRDSGIDVVTEKDRSAKVLKFKINTNPAFKPEPAAQGGGKVDDGDTPF
jgi:hypothetical protein